MRNIIWIIVDSVRNYTCPAERVDDRGRIELMNELGDSWIDCRTVVTSAPSTVMSISAMLTSCPAYYLGANFMGMRLENCGRPNIATILKPLGYHTYCITLGPHEREAWDGVLEVIPHRLWPWEAKHRREWDNGIVNAALKNLVENGVRQPFFFLLHYNCRQDDRISERVGEGLRRLESAGLMDNSVVFLTSDHGYPDPLRKEEVARRRKAAAIEHRKSAHDLVLTDDNVLVPLLVRYPGHAPRRIEQQICTLDYLPTSLELAGIMDYPELFGQSVAPLLRGEAMPELEERMVRIDGRFLAQTGRCTAVRSKRQKYIIYPDAPAEQREQLFDLVRDTLETDNLLEHGTNGHDADVSRFRQWFEKDNIRCRRVQTAFMKEMFLREQNNIASLRHHNTPRSVLFVRSGRAGFDELFEQVLREIYGQESVAASDLQDLKSLPRVRYDLAIAAVTQLSRGPAVCRAFASTRAQCKLFVNLSLNVMRFTRSYVLAALLKDWRLNRKYYLAEPLYWLSKVIQCK